MGKTKRRKNSNYKANFETKNDAAAKDKKKNLIIAIVCAVIGVLFVGGMIVGIVVSSLPKIYYVEMDFGEYGSIVIEVDGEEAPITAKNFMKLVKKGFYDGLTIFRAQENFVIQGGRDDTANLSSIVGEFESNGYTNTISHLRGVISMARSSLPNSATSQFFITLHDDAKKSLDGRYAAFGRVVEGMDVVDAIAEAIMQCPSDSMGFVADNYAIEIVSAKQLKNYKK